MYKTNYQETVTWVSVFISDSFLILKEFRLEFFLKGIYDNIFRTLQCTQGILNNNIYKVSSKDSLSVDTEKA